MSYKIWATSIFLVVLAGAFTFVALKPTPAPDNLGTLRDLFPKGDWIVLKRPTSAWSVGTVVEKAEDIGHLETAGCFPASVWNVKQANVAPRQFSHEIGWNVNLGVNRSSGQSGSAGVEVGNEALVVTLRINEAQERTLDILKLEDWLSTKSELGVANYEEMKIVCKKLLTSSDRHIVTKTFRVLGGQLEMKNAAGARFDVSVSELKKIASALVGGDIRVTQDGQIDLSASDTGYTIAVRVVPRLDRVIAKIDGLGTTLSSSEDIENEFREDLRKEGLIVEY